MNPRPLSGSDFSSLRTSAMSPTTAAAFTSHLVTMSGLCLKGLQFLAPFGRPLAERVQKPARKYAATGKSECIRGRRQSHLPVLQDLHSKLGANRMQHCVKGDVFLRELAMQSAAIASHLFRQPVGRAAAGSYLHPHQFACLRFETGIVVVHECVEISPRVFCKDRVPSRHWKIKILGCNNKSVAVAAKLNMWPG